MNEMLEVSGLKPLIENYGEYRAPASRYLVLVFPLYCRGRPPPPPGVGPVITVCLCSCLIPRTEAPTLMDGVVIGES